MSFAQPILLIFKSRVLVCLTASFEANLLRLLVILQNVVDSAGIRWNFLYLLGVSRRNDR